MCVPEYPQDVAEVGWNVDFLATIQSVWKNKLESEVSLLLPTGQFIFTRSQIQD